MFDIQNCSKADLDEINRRAREFKFIEKQGSEGHPGSVPGRSTPEDFKATSELEQSELPL